MYDWSSYTRQGVEEKGYDWSIFCRAIDRLTMYTLVDDNVFTYQELGVPEIFGGALPSRIIKEHNVISGFYSNAYKEKRQRDGKKGKK